MSLSNPKPTGRNCWAISQGVYYKEKIEKDAGCLQIISIAIHEQPSGCFYFHCPSYTKQVSRKKYFIIANNFIKESDICGQQKKQDEYS